MMPKCTFQAAQVDRELTSMNYYFVVANEELEDKAFEQEVWKEGNLLLVRSNLPHMDQRSCSSMNAELLMGMPQEFTVSCAGNKILNGHIFKRPPEIK